MNGLKISDTVIYQNEECLIKNDIVKPTLKKNEEYTISQILIEILEIIKTLDIYITTQKKGVEINNEINNDIKKYGEVFYKYYNKLSMVEKTRLKRTFFYVLIEANKYESDYEKLTKEIFENVNIEKVETSEWENFSNVLLKLVSSFIFVNIKTNNSLYSENNKSKVCEVIYKCLNKDGLLNDLNKISIPKEKMSMNFNESMSTLKIINKVLSFKELEDKIQFKKALRNIIDEKYIIKLIKILRKPFRELSKSEKKSIKNNTVLSDNKLNNLIKITLMEEDEINEDIQLNEKNSLLLNKYIKVIKSEIKKIVNSLSKELKQSECVGLKYVEWMKEFENPRKMCFLFNTLRECYKIKNDENEFVNFIKTQSDKIKDIKCYKEKNGKIEINISNYYIYRGFFKFFEEAILSKIIVNEELFSEYELKEEIVKRNNFYIKYKNVFKNEKVSEDQKEELLYENEKQRKYISFLIRKQFHIEETLVKNLIIENKKYETIESELDDNCIYIELRSNFYKNKELIKILELMMNTKSQEVNEKIKVLLDDIEKESMEFEVKDIKKGKVRINKF